MYQVSYLSFQPDCSFVGRLPGTRLIYFRRSWAKASSLRLTSAGTRTNLPRASRWRPDSDIEPNCLQRIWNLDIFKITCECSSVTMCSCCMMLRMYSQGLCRSKRRCWSCCECYRAASGYRKHQTPAVPKQRRAVLKNSCFDVYSTHPDASQCRMASFLLVDVFWF